MTNKALIAQARALDVPEGYPLPLPPPSGWLDSVLWTLRELAAALERADR